MPNYAIMRCKKLKMSSVPASLEHCFRERETLNADADRTPENQNLILEADSKKAVMQKLRTRLDEMPKTRRKDAVVAVEYLMTASPEWWQGANDQQKSAFFERSVAWLAEKYGSENILAATVHTDEQTPHLSAYVVPLTTDKRLSAKTFIGNRTQMSEDQTTYAQCVEDLGLKRGVEGSKAKHQRISQMYKTLTTPVEVPKLTAKDRFAWDLGINTKKLEKLSQAFEDAFSKAEVWDTQKERIKARERDLDRFEGKLNDDRAALDEEKRNLTSLEMDLLKQQRLERELRSELEQVKRMRDGMQQLRDKTLQENRELKQMLGQNRGFTR